VFAAVGRELANFEGITRGLCTLAVSLAIAWILYIAAEEPCARLSHRLLAGILAMRPEQRVIKCRGVLARNIRSWAHTVSEGHEKHVT
jgi:peptidoglycan/LPS O-acetylase OafA/YrhL